MPIGISSDGHWQMGRSHIPATDLNFLGGAEAPLFPRLRLKEWHYLSFSNPRYFLAFAIVQLGYATTLFAYLRDKESGETWEFGERKPLHWNVEMAASSTVGNTVWRSKAADIFIRGSRQHWDVSLRLPLGGKTLQGNLHVDRGQEALALMYPLGQSRGAYTHKEAGMRGTGELSWGGDRIRFEADETFCLSDWTRSYAKRKTVWNWASAAWGTTEHTFGFNFSAKVYDDAEGHSQENCVWCDGKAYFVPGVEFVIPNKAKERWEIRTKDPNHPVQVALSFFPQGARSENANYLIVRSQFVQVFGHFQGSVVLPDKTIEVKDVFGVSEDHLAVW